MIRVEMTFHHEESGYCYDVFRRKIISGGKEYTKYYARMEPRSGADYVEWNTAGVGFYEPGSPLKADVEITFTMNGKTYIEVTEKEGRAKKVAPFSWEHLDEET